MQLIIDVEACNGCRICELACSFHHQRAFTPEYSSVKVYSDYQQGTIQLRIDATCDLCKKEEQPLCVQYCVTGALRKEMGNESS